MKKLIMYLVLGLGLATLAIAAGAQSRRLPANTVDCDPQMRNGKEVKHCTIEADAAQSPKPPVQWTYQELEARYQVLNAQYWQTTDLVKTRAILVELDPIGQELTRRNVAALQANSAAFDNLGQQMLTAAAQIQIEAHQKWCHQNLWRLVRGYHEPRWCNQ